MDQARDILVQIKDILKELSEIQKKTSSIVDDEPKEDNDDGEKKEEKKEEKKDKMETDSKSEKTEKSELLAELSNKFFEIFPQDHASEAIKPINTFADLGEKFKTLDSLVDISQACKILMGAIYNAKQGKIHPLDYCYYALGVNMGFVDPISAEHKLLMRYINNGRSHSRVISIHRVERYAERERFQKWSVLSNRLLLWHGSRVSNFLGILSLGLRIAPPEAPKTGWNFGKGIYFSDHMSKSVGYCDSTKVENEDLVFAPKDATEDEKKKYTNINTSFLILCEVALGNMFERINPYYMEGAKEGFQSTKALGRHGPNPEENVVLNDGVQVPVGKAIEYPKRVMKVENAKYEDSDDEMSEEEDDGDSYGHSHHRYGRGHVGNAWHSRKTAKTKAQPAPSTEPPKMEEVDYVFPNNEYIVYDESQVRIRYIVQIAN
eukprot:TRINITY_DN15024_c0_g1_i1.p1 TRINITY_DN15024_c0_g1~~TRINITY_DN15024_c0_g1_i1.p1  ORF type:complete len:453 (-),score=101.32 TRINITY_DN15024_c0_g1_i1:58-1359(-)